MRHAISFINEEEANGNDFQKLQLAANYIYRSCYLIEGNVVGFSDVCTRKMLI